MIELNWDYKIMAIEVYLPSLGKCDQPLKFTKHGYYPREYDRVFLVEILGVKLYAISSK